MRAERREIVIAGAGFAGSILARILALRGRDVVLVERGSHPRFALGESSTPLASLCLERLAAAHGLEDLHRLAAYGRWTRHMPSLRRGLKRGFTFYRHRPGCELHQGGGESERLLVAASPDDEVADSHWFREDVDAFLVARAVQAGVDYRDRTRLDAFEQDGEGVEVSGEGPGGCFRLAARFLVDASGGDGFLARALPLPSSPATGPARQLLYGHFSAPPDFAALARAAGARLPPGPYPDDRAAVHHLLEEGWIYALGFDHGVLSAGLLSRDDPPAGEPPEAGWRRVLARYPALERQLGEATPLRPITRISGPGHRLSRPAGERWLLLPHAYAFFDPLFSTGIAWSLLAVERAAELLATGLPRRDQLGRYGDLLAAEADQIGDLVAAAYQAMGDFEAFTAAAFLYFAAASFQELAQRLTDDPGGGWAWQGLLGATDPVSRGFVAEGRRRLEQRTPAPIAFAEWVRGAIAPRNVVGLADPRRRHLYPVDLDVLLDRSHLLGLTRRQAEARLPRLRGG